LEVNEKTIQQKEVANEIKELKFEGHKLRAEIGELENGDETIRLTAENGGELPGGIHGKNDPMDALINKYLEDDD